MSGEKIIISDAINSSGEDIGDETDRLYLYDGLTTPFSKDIIVLAQDHMEQIRRIALNCITNYGPNGKNNEPQPESTYVQEKHGIPTLIGRIDCTLGDNGDIVAYELEDSPSGIGVTDTIHRSVGSIGISGLVTEHYLDVLGQLPYLIVSGTRSHGTDDALVLGKDNYFYEKDSLTLPPNLSSERLVIVKAIPGVPESLDGYRSLVDRSVCTLTSEGNKAYGPRVGMLKQISTIDELLKDSESGQIASQALKRAVGSMAMGIKVYLTPEDRQKYGKGRTVNLNGLEKALVEFIGADGYAYTQSFYPAIRSINQQGRKNLIMRVFTLITPVRDQNSDPAVKVIGGCYVARSEVVVHGASNAVCGAVVVE